MGGGGSQDSTVTNVQQIDPVTQQWRQTLMNAGGGLYNQGAPAFYPGQTVAPFSDQTQGGLDALQSYAQGGVPNMGASNNATARILDGGNPAMFGAHYTAQGGLNNQMAGGLGQYGQGVNPGLQSLFQQGAGQISDAVNANFAQAGRFGPNAAHTGAMTREIGNLWNQINVPAWEAERNRGLTANQTMAQVGDANVNRQLAGLGMIGDLHTQGNENALRAQALMPSMYQLGMMPGQNMLDIGSMYEGQAQNYIDADRERYDYNANAPWQNLQNYAQLMSGLPDFSSSTTTQRGPGTNRAMSALGGGMAGAGIASALSLSGPVGWGLAGAGALAGLF